MNKTVEYYIGLPYTIELWRAPEGGWIVQVKELPGCLSQGETAEEALAMIQDAMQGWLEVALEYGDPVPEPRSEAEYSGKFVVRVPRALHRELVATADREGVSLNQYINTILAQAVGRAAPPPQRGLHVSSDAFEPVVRKLGMLIQQLELTLISRDRLSDVRIGQQLAYTTQQSALLAVHEDKADYEIGVLQSGTLPEDPDLSGAPEETNGR